MSAPTPTPVPPPPSRPNLPGRKTPHYQGGQWSEGTSWLADALDTTGGSGWEQGLRKLGYSESITAGTEYGLRVVLYDRSGQDPAPYLVQISDCNRFEEVSAATFWDALDLMNRWAPLITATLISAITNELVLNNDRHASWLTDILAGVQANRPYIEHRADQIREQYADQDRRQRERRRQRAAQQGGAA